MPNFPNRFCAALVCGLLAPIPGPPGLLGAAGVVVPGGDAGADAATLLAMDTSPQLDFDSGDRGADPTGETAANPEPKGGLTAMEETLTAMDANPKPEIEVVCRSMSGATQWQGGLNWAKDHCIKYSPERQTWELNLVAVREELQRREDFKFLLYTGEE